MRFSGDVNLPLLVERGEFQDLDARARALLAYAEKLTLRPADMAEGDLAPLREAGLSDEDILDATMITSYYGYMNRIVDALGVGLAPEQVKLQEEIESRRALGG